MDHKKINPIQRVLKTADKTSKMELKRRSFLRNRVNSFSQIRSSKEVRVESNKRFHKIIHASIYKIWGKQEINNRHGLKVTLNNSLNLSSRKYLRIRRHLTNHRLIEYQIRRIIYRGWVFYLPPLPLL